ncbi:MAG: GNAT family N-acetyltransferase [Alphaproteobacteria bacterium]|nr:GNAT family N-acetyltransferase [Alphaproteobacteria bacterium]
MPRFGLDHSLPARPVSLRDGRAVTLRRIQEEDAEGYWRLQHEIVAAGRGVVLLPEELPEQPEPGKLLFWRTHPDSLCVVALAEGRVVGEASVKRYTPTMLAHSAVFAMGVVPDWQGCGLGRLIAETAVRWADDNGLARLELAVLADNDRAQALYRSLGFQVAWRRRGFLRWPDGREVDDLWMEREAARAPAQRPVTPEDAPFLTRLFASTLDPTLAALGGPIVALQELARERHYAQAWPDAERVVLEVDGTPVGSWWTRRAPGGWWAIDIALTPEVRGRGLGAAVLRAFQREAAAVGEPVGLHVARQNPAARLYARLGFEVVGEDGTHFELRWTPRGAGLG